MVGFRVALRGCLESYMTIFDLTQPVGPLNHLSAADIAAQLQALPSEKRTQVLEHLDTGIEIAMPARCAASAKRARCEEPGASGWRW